MIQFITGNLMDSNAQALVNTVNTVGVMGKGIALQFKKQFPNNYSKYQKAYKNKELAIGKLLVTEEENLLSGKKIIINFPTKKHWRQPSKYEYIDEGLKELVKFIDENNIQSVAIPPLGAGNGGLDWQKVKQLMIDRLSNVNADIYIYEPNAQVKEVLKKERVKLTPARAMLLSVLYELTRNGEFVSEFSAEKVAYFLQRFGAKDDLKLEFHADFYGPYSGKVRHVLYHLNGSYITGYYAKDKKPFEELGLNYEAEEGVTDFLSQPAHVKYFEIVQKVKDFLTGYFSPFGLELLSTVDFIMQEHNTVNKEVILEELSKWSDRKRTMFKNEKFVDLAIDQIQSHLN